MQVRGHEGLSGSHGGEGGRASGISGGEGPGNQLPAIHAREAVRETGKLGKNGRDQTRSEMYSDVVFIIIL